MILDRNSILGAIALPQVREIDVPELGDGAKVYVRVISGAERDSLEKVIDKGSVPARLACLTLSDREGRRLFTDADLPEVSKLNSVALMRIYSAASKLNRLSQKDIDDLEKNSESAT